MRMISNQITECNKNASIFYLQGFPGDLIAVGHFLDSFLWDVSFICWKLDSMASFWTSSLEIPIGFIQQGCCRVQFLLH